MPVVGVNLKTFGNFFINAHIAKDDEKIIYVICENKEESEELLSIITRLKINPNFIDTEIIEDEIIIKFKIPQEYYEIYKLFLEGSYSKFSSHYKKILTGIYGSEVIQDRHAVTEYNVLYPQDYKRKQIAARLGVDYKLINEVIDSPDLGYEIYKTLTELNNIDDSK